MKTPKPLVIKADKVKDARRKARITVGAVPPSRSMVPKTLRKPKHKKQAEE